MIVPWELTSEEKEAIMEQIAELRCSWNNFEAHILGNRFRPEDKLYKVY